MSEYFVPIQKITKIDDDMLVIGLEGNNFKPNLPELRVGSEVPFTFQIVDYDTGLPGRRLRQKVEVILNWADDYHRCTKPFPCVAPEVIAEDFASTLYTMAAVSSMALFTALAF